jgi:hypothetical protein
MAQREQIRPARMDLARDSKKERHECTHPATKSAT